MHRFGAPNTPQNLTFADGSKGWSFEDKKGGTYLYFKRDARAWKSMLPDGEDASGGTATVFSPGYTALIAGFAALLGLLLGIAGSGMVRRRKRTAA